MNSVDAAMIIAGEIAELHRFREGHQFDAYFLDTPLLSTYRDMNGMPWELWTVLRMPNDEYVVFDDYTKKFYWVIEDEPRDSFPTLHDALGVHKAF